MPSPFARCRCSPLCRRPSNLRGKEKVETDQVPGVAPPTTPYSFCLPKMSKQQKGTPSPGPLRGFPAHGRRLAGQRLAALKHLSAFTAKRPPHSGGGESGNHDPKIPIID